MDNKEFPSWVIGAISATCLVVGFGAGYAINSSSTVQGQFTGSGVAYYGGDIQGQGSITLDQGIINLINDLVKKDAASKGITIKE